MFTPHQLELAARGDAVEGEKVNKSKMKMGGLRFGQNILIALLSLSTASSSNLPYGIHPLGNCFCFVFSIFYLKKEEEERGGVSNELGVIDEWTDDKYYESELIRCKDGSNYFPRIRINDDFCDCPDGSDEPGTFSYNYYDYYFYFLVLVFKMGLPRLVYFSPEWCIYVAGSTLQELRPVLLGNSIVGMLGVLHAFCFLHV